MSRDTSEAPTKPDFLTPAYQMSEGRTPTPMEIALKLREAYERGVEHGTRSTDYPIPEPQATPNNVLKSYDEESLKSWLCEIAHSDGMPAKPEEREAARTLMAMFGWEVCSMCDRPAKGSVVAGLGSVCSPECAHDYVYNNGK